MSFILWLVCEHREKLQIVQIETYLIYNNM